MDSQFVRLALNLNKNSLRYLIYLHSSFSKTRITYITITKLSNLFNKFRGVYSQLKSLYSFTLHRNSECKSPYQQANHHFKYKIIYF